MSNPTPNRDQKPVHRLLLQLPTYLSITQVLFLQYTPNMKKNHFDPLITQDRTFVQLPRAPGTLILSITLNQWLYTNNTDVSILLDCQTLQLLVHQLQKDLIHTKHTFESEYWNPSKAILHRPTECRHSTEPLSARNP